MNNFTCWLDSNFQYGWFPCGSDSNFQAAFLTEHVWLTYCFIYWCWRLIEATPLRTFLRSRGFCRLVRRIFLSASARGFTFLGNIRKQSFIKFYFHSQNKCDVYATMASDDNQHNKAGVLSELLWGGHIRAATASGSAAAGGAMYFNEIRGAVCWERSFNRHTVPQTIKMRMTIVCMGVGRILSGSA